MAQDVFNDMVKAAKLGDSANSKPALDAAKILSGLVKNSSERAAVFTTLSVDVNNSEVMKKFGLNGKVEKDASGNIESIIFSSLVSKGHGDIKLTAKPATKVDATATTQTATTNDSPAASGASKVDSTAPASSSENDEDAVAYYNNHLSSTSGDAVRQPRTFTTSSGGIGESYPGEILLPYGQETSYTPNSDGTATSFINSDGSTGVAYPDGSVQMNPTISSY